MLARPHAQEITPFSEYVCSHGGKTLSTLLAPVAEPSGSALTDGLPASTEPSLESPISVVHVITGVQVGGAERTLLKLLSHMDRNRFHCSVVSLSGAGAIGDEIQELGIPVYCLEMRSDLRSAASLFQLARILRKIRPDVVQTWMYHADLVGSLAAWLAGRIPVVWNIRRTQLTPGLDKRRTIWVMRACSRLSSTLPSRIVCCSDSARAAHITAGYSASRMLTIPNGFDPTVFKPDPAARAAVRQELGIDPKSPLIGLIGRFHPLKEHQSFIQAARVLAAHHTRVHFLLCGRDVTPQNALLTGWIRKAGLDGRFHLLGPRNDVPRLMASLDIACSASRTEGFANVIGEAMACGVPCVVTNVGDSARIVGATGKVVQPNQPDSMARAFEDILRCGEHGRQSMGIAARERAENYFDLASTVRRYESLYQDVAEDYGRLPKVARGQ